MKLKLPTTFYFGSECVKNNLSNELTINNIKNVLLVAGSGSIKKNGLYKLIVNECIKAKVKLHEHWGVQPNPIESDAYSAALKARRIKADLIIAAGGGSVIDESKVVGALANNVIYKSGWEYVKFPHKLTKPSLPIWAIVTIAATGSENNHSSVITNEKTHEKISVHTQSAIPKITFEDPNYTMTLSKWQTSCGVFDIFCHLYEDFFNTKQDFDWTSEYLLANMRVIYKHAKIIVTNPNNINSRANILWTSSMSLNSLAKFNTSGGDWNTHHLEHGISGLWNVSHGAGLALIAPVYFHYQLNIAKNKIFRNKALIICREIFNGKTLDDFFIYLKKFITMLHLPSKYTDFNEIKNVSKSDIEWLIKFYKKNDGRDNKMATYVFNNIKI